LQPRTRMAIKRSRLRFAPWDDRGNARSLRLVAGNPRRSTPAAPVGA
jgi:hypothetical protein